MPEPTRPTRGPAIGAVVIPDDPETWVGAGFTVDDGHVVVGSLRLSLVGSPARPVGLAFTPGDLDLADLDGIPVVSSEVRATSGAPHPNGVTGVDHLVITTPDLERTVTALTDAGFPERRRRPVPGSDPAMTQVFFWAGDVIVELAGPDESTGDGPAELWGLALVADDLDAVHTHLGETSSAPRPAVQRGRRILALRHRDLGLSLPVAVMSPHLD